MKAIEILTKIKSYNSKPLRIIPTDKEFDEAIAELEALQQPKSCEGCKYGVFESKIKYVSVMDEQMECCLVCVRNSNDYFEDKEQ